MPISATGSSPAVEGGSGPVRRRAEHGFTSLPRSAEHGFTPFPRSAEHGFTLVELMVVLVIVGLTSAAVLFAMPDPRGALREEAERFAARLRVAQEQAVLEGRPVAVLLSTGGYAFQQGSHGRWTAPAEPALRARDWGGGVIAREASGEARATFDPTGGADPFVVTLARDGRRLTVTLAADGAIRVGA